MITYYTELYHLLHVLWSILKCGKIQTLEKDSKLENMKAVPNHLSILGDKNSNIPKNLYPSITLFNDVNTKILHTTKLVHYGL